MSEAGNEGSGAPKEEVGSEYERSASDPGRVSDAAAVPTTLPERRDAGVPSAPGGGHPAVADPLPDIDELVTVQTLEAVIQRKWIGPMADPETLRQYEEVVPGMAERLLRVYESQTVQVSDREDMIVLNRHAIDLGGQRWAGVIALSCIAAAAPMLWQGNVLGGSVLLSMPVVLLVASFIPRRPPRSADKTAE